jgi:hypothetical protein
MNETLDKMKKALEGNKESISLKEVYGKEQADSIGDKIDVLMRMAENGRLYNTFSDQIGRYERYMLDEEEAEWVLAFTRTYTHLQKVWTERFARDGAKFIQTILPEILKDIAGVNTKIDIREIPKGLAEALDRLIDEQDEEDEEDSEKKQLLNLFDEAKASAKKAGLKADEDERALAEEE